MQPRKDGQKLISSFICVASFIGLLMIAALFVRSSRLARSKRQESYEHYRSRFDQACNVLASTKTTPQFVLNILKALNNVMMSASSARLFFYYYGIASHHFDCNHKHDGLNEFIRSDTLVGRQFLEALTCGLLALTFLGRTWGGEARKMLTAAPVGTDQLSRVVEALQRVGKL